MVLFARYHIEEAIMILSLFVSLIGCQFSSNTPVNCYALERGPEKNDCWSREILDVVSQDSQEALRII